MRDSFGFNKNPNNNTTLCTGIFQYRGVNLVCSERCSVYAAALTVDMQHKE